MSVSVIMIRRRVSVIIGSFLRRLSSLCRESADKVLVPVQRCFCASRRKCSTASLIEPFRTKSHANIHDPSAIQPKASNPTRSGNHSSSPASADGHRNAFEQYTVHLPHRKVRRKVDSARLRLRVVCPVGARGKCSRAAWDCCCLERLCFSRSGRCECCCRRSCSAHRLGHVLLDHPATAAIPVVHPVGLPWHRAGSRTRSEPP